MLKLFVFVAVVALASANLTEPLDSHSQAAAIAVINQHIISDHDEADQSIPTQGGVIHHVNARATQDECGCPSSFISCAGRCYQRIDIAGNHERARELCKLLTPKAHLAVPRSHQANLCVAGLAGNKGIWLGITDIQEEGLFVGDDDLGLVDLPGNGHTWTLSQPDNFQDEDCVEMWLGHGFADWNDRQCGYTDNVPMCQLGD